MSVFSDMVDSILGYADKSGAGPQKAAEQAVIRSIDRINAEMQNHTVASRDKTIAVTAAQQTVTLAVEARKIIELGLYDSGTDRIKVPYTEITEQQFHQIFRGAQTLPSCSLDSVNLWCLLDDNSTRQRVIRLVYPPSAAFTMEVRWYEKLDKENMDRLEQTDVIYDRAIMQLGSWFPNVLVVHMDSYRTGIEVLKANRRSMLTTIPVKTRPDIAAHNAVAGFLVS